MLEHPKESTAKTTGTLSKLNQSNAWDASLGEKQLEYIVLQSVALKGFSTEVDLWYYLQSM